MSTRRGRYKADAETAVVSNTPNTASASPADPGNIMVSSSNSPPVLQGLGADSPKPTTQPHGSTPNAAIDGRTSGVRPCATAAVEKKVRLRLYE